VHELICVLRFFAGFKRVSSGYLGGLYGCPRQICWPPPLQRCFRCAWAREDVSSAAESLREAARSASLWTSAREKLGRDRRRRLGSGHRLGAGCSPEEAVAGRGAWHGRVEVWVCAALSAGGRWGGKVWRGRQGEGEVVTNPE
jgi:hypothetical protein